MAAMPPIIVTLMRPHQCAEYCPWHGPRELFVSRLFHAIRRAPRRLRASYLAELQAVAFARNMNGADYQARWDASTDPVALYEAIYATKDDAALALLGEALGRIGADMERAYDAADPMAWPDAPQRKQHLVVTLHEAMDAGDFLLFLLTALEATIYVTGDAEACKVRACRRLRYYFPSAPWGFDQGARHLDDERLLGRALALEDYFPGKARSYVQALTARPSPMRPANREKLLDLLRKHTPWM